MGKIGWITKVSECDKSELVLQICSMQTMPMPCPHKHHSNTTHFTDWYRILGVAENAGFQQIKRRYHKLALQLHPDKNHHPKAGIAFKLVAEAFACLSDHTRRRSFNIERSKHFCSECNTIPSATDTSDNNCPKPGKFLRNLRQMRDRFKEEILVIENCLRVNKRDFPSTSRVYMNKTDRETPVFEPSEYVFHGYPHLRDQIYETSERFQELQRPSVGERGRYHSHRFQNSGTMMKSRSVCIHL